MEVNTGHLTYCTNIHPGKNWAEDFEALKLNFPIIKANVAAEKAMGLGLRLSNASSLQLEKPEVLALFQQWLTEQDAYVFTMNGFPYGEFHRTVVKEDVHAPDWTTEDRKNYTIRIFNILKQLLPEGMEGGISTSPLSYRYWFNSPEELAAATQKGTQHVLDVLKHLIGIFKETGMIMHLDMEPEPDGIIETGREFIDWFEHTLLPMGVPEIANSFKVSDEEAKVLLQQHLCLCYDVCHFAMGYEDHATVLQELALKGIRVGKIQISAALKADMKRGPQEKEEVKSAFEQFNEPTYLHQVVARKADGTLLRYRDLPEALSDFQNEEVLEWRSHFHVPISIKEIGLLSSTQSDIETLLELQQAKPFSTHLEVETYTWEVLPEQLKLPIAQSISNELNWVLQKLA